MKGQKNIILNTPHLSSYHIYGVDKTFETSLNIMSMKTEHYYLGAKKMPSLL